MPSPAREGALEFREILCPVVDAGHPTVGGAADMVHDGFGDKGLSPEFVVHDRGGGSPQVVKPSIDGAAASAEAFVIGGVYALLVSSSRGAVALPPTGDDGAGRGDEGFAAGLGGANTESWGHGVTEFLLYLVGYWVFNAQRNDPLALD